MKSYVSAALYAILLILGGCQDRPEDDPASAAAPAADSAGVPVVNNPAKAPVTWQLAQAPKLRLGSGSEDGDHEFFRVRGAALLSDGRLVVANAGSGELRIYDIEGQLSHTTGGVGYGPNEFQSLVLGGIFRGDSILAVDIALQRASVFDSSGVLSRTFRFDEEFGSLPRPAGVLFDGTVLLRPEVVSGEPAAEESRPSEVRRPKYPLWVASPEGEPRILLDTVPVNERYVSGRYAGEHLFGRRLHVAGAHDRIAVGTDDHFSIRIHDANGQLLMVVRQLRIPERVSPADYERGVEDILSRFGDQWARDLVAGALLEAPRHEVLPAYGALKVDPIGQLWVEDYRRPWEENAVWQVFDREGVLIAQLVPPDGLEVLDVSPQHLVGLRRDAVGVEFIEVWDINTPPPA